MCLLACVQQVTFTAGANGGLCLLCTLPWLRCRYQQEGAAKAPQAMTAKGGGRGNKLTTLRAARDEGIGKAKVEYISVSTLGKGGAWQGKHIRMPASAGREAFTRVHWRAPRRCGTQWLPLATPLRNQWTTVPCACCAQACVWPKDV